MTDGTPAGGKRVPVGQRVPAGQRLKGVAQMAAGAALACAGVVMCVLPGPGIAAIAGGVVLACRGQRNFTGRSATRAERKMDRVTARLVAKAKQEAAEAVRKASHRSK